MMYVLDKVNFSVKLENQIGKPFVTNVGSPHGDGASAVFFITYIALSLLIYLNKVYLLHKKYKYKLEVKLETKPP